MSKDNMRTGKFRLFKKAGAAVLAASIVLSGLPMSAFASLTATTTDTSVPGWKFQSTYSDSNAYIDTTDGVLGEASLKIVNRTPRTSKGEYCVLYSDISTKKGHSYTLEFSAKAKDVNAGTVFFNYGTRSSLSPITKTYDWTNYKISYTEQSDSGTATLRFAFDDVTEAFWLDNVKVYDKTEPGKNLLSNGDFENKTGPALPTEEGTEEAEKEDMLADYISSPMTIDGDLSDWKSIEPMQITRKQDFYEDDSKGVIAADIEADVRFAYDDENLYLAFTSKDAVHVVAENNKYWDGDGVQFSYGDDYSILHERGITYNPETGEVYVNTGDITAAVVREDDVTTYECAIPWSLDFPNGRPDSISFNAVVNNNDGSGRRFCMEITPGISMNKDITQYRTLCLLKKIGGASYTFSYPATVTLGEENKAKVSFYNNSKETKKISVSSALAGASKNISLAPGESRAEELCFTAKNWSGEVMDVSLECDGEVQKIEKDIFVVLDYSVDFASFKERTEKNIAELKALLLECKDKGISTDYEDSSYAIISRFLEHAQTLHERGFNQYISKIDKELQAEYEKTKANLNAYLKGEKEGLSVPRFLVTEEGIRLNGTSVVAKTEDDGKIEERPVFLTGSLGFGTTCWEDLSFMSQMGWNSAHLEVSMAEVFSPHRAEGWSWGQENKCLGAFVDTADTASAGERAMQVVNDGKGTGFCYIKQKVEVEPGATYEIGLKAKGKSLKSNSLWYGANNQNMPGRNYISDSSDWKEYSSTWTMGADQTVAYFCILNENTAENCYIDEVYMRKAGTSENLLKNPSFENVYETSYDAETEELGFRINEYKIDQFRKALELAEQNNMMIDLNLCQHYMPYWITSKSPDAASVSSTFLTFALNDEYVKKVISVWSRYMTSIAAEYDCVNSICVTNEPGQASNLFEYYKPYWWEYLKEVHGTVEAMNEKYGTDYTSFEEVEMPPYGNYTAVHYDHQNFNNKLLADLHRFIYDEIRKENKDILLNMKITQNLQYGGRQYYHLSLKAADICDLYEINGCDAYSYYGRKSTPMYVKMGWFDYMTSLKDAPVWDTESHFLEDRTYIEDDDLIAYYVGTDAWLGGLHGRGCNELWLWDLTSTGLPTLSRPNSPMMNTNLVLRPADTVETVRANLDLNRLSYEVEAITKADRNVGILYSITSMNYVKNDVQISMFGEAYKDAIERGQRAGFVVESQLEKINNYPLVVVPEMTHVPASVLEALKGYVDGGGKLLILYDTALRLDEYGKEHDKALVDYIYSKAITGKTTAEVIEDMGLCDIKLVDAETGKELSDIEYNYAEYNGKMLLSIANYKTAQTDKVKVLYKGEEVSDMLELRSNEKITTGFELKPYQPILIEF